MMMAGRPLEAEKPMVVNDCGNWSDCTLCTRTVVCVEGLYAGFDCGRSRNESVSKKEDFEEKK